MSERRGGPVGEDRARNSAAETYKYISIMLFVGNTKYTGTIILFISLYMTLHLAEANLDTPRKFIQTFSHSHSLIRKPQYLSTRKMTAYAQKIKKPICLLGTIVRRTQIMLIKHIGFKLSGDKILKQI